MKYKVLRDAKFRAGKNKKLYVVRKGDLIDVDGEINKNHIGELVEVVKGGK